MACLQDARDKIAARTILCFLFFLGIMVTFLLRVNINLAIVGMVNMTLVSQDIDAGTAGVTGACLQVIVDNTTSVNLTLEQEVLQQPIEEGEFSWDELQQSMILSSFFWGYLIFQAPGGRIAEVVGPKRVFGASVFLNGVLSLLTPFAARAHWSFLLAIRALQGLAQGVVFPTLSAAVVRWVPIPERARFLSFAVQGASLGTVIAMPLCGSVFNAWGWPAVFYVSGFLALAWCLAWWYLVFDTPDQHPRISRSEKLYLEQQLPKDDRIDEDPPVPWGSVLTSWQFLIGCIAAIGNDWGFHTFLTLGPKYVKGALGFDMTQSSWLTSLPFLCQYIFANAYGVLADKLLEKKIMSVRSVRKLSVVFSHIMPAASLVALSLTGCQVTLAIAVLTLAVTMLGAYSSGFFQNPIDIAPNFAGSLTGLMNAVGSVTGIISTPVAGAVLHKDNTTAGWRIIFLIAATMYTICSLPYLLCATAEVQSWNNTATKEKEKVEVNETTTIHIVNNIEDAEEETSALNKPHENSKS